MSNSYGSFEKARLKQNPEKWKQKLEAHMRLSECYQNKTSIRHTEIHAGHLQAKLITQTADFPICIKEGR